LVASNSPNKNLKQKKQVKQANKQINMKINKSILALALGLGLAGSCFGGTVYLSGSTAARGTVYNLLAATNVIFNGAPAITSSSSSASGGNYMAFQGTLYGGSGTTTILCSWSGSEAGIANVASNTATAFYATFYGSGDINTVSNTTTTVATPTGGNHPVDLAMADNAQQYSRTTTPTLTGDKVCVVTFKWLRNAGLWTGSNTNITDSQIQQALAGGAPLAVFTGNVGDTNSRVYVSGRDHFSGTRVNAFANSGFGIFSPPEQIILTSGNMTYEPSTGDPSYGYYAGDFGQSSGGTLAGTLTNSTVSSLDYVNGAFNGITNVGFSVIAYLGFNDAATGIAGGATELAYNGVPFSIAAIREGTYSYWGNEYVYRANTLGSPTEATTVYNDIKNDLNNFCYPNGGANANAISLSYMNCGRSGPLTAPAHN
jgi:hypothetical protein